MTPRTLILETPATYSVAKSPCVRSFFFLGSLAATPADADDDADDDDDDDVVVASASNGISFKHPIP